MASVIGGFVRGIVKEVVLLPVNVVAGVADAIEEVVDPPPPKGKKK